MVGRLRRRAAEMVCQRSTQVKRLTAVANSLLAGAVAGCVVLTHTHGIPMQETTDQRAYNSNPLGRLFVRFLKLQQWLKHTNERANAPTELCYRRCPLAVISPYES